VAVSDGVVNSFDDIYNNRELYSYLLDTEKYIRNQNSEKYKCELRKKIYTLSEENSGDDVSLAGFYVVFENSDMQT
jgi:hypothetical protein